MDTGAVLAGHRTEPGINTQVSQDFRQRSPYAAEACFLTRDCLTVTTDVVDHHRIGRVGDRPPTSRSHRWLKPCGAT